MNGQTSASASHRRAATGANTTTDTTSAIAVAPPGSRSRPRIRFQSACRKADPSARAKASSGIAATVGSCPDEDHPCARLRLQRDALARRARPLRDLLGALRRARPAAQRGGLLRPAGGQHRGGDHPRLARRRGRGARGADRGAHRPVRPRRRRLDRARRGPRGRPPRRDAASRSRSSPAPTGARSSRCVESAGLADAVARRSSPPTT